MMRWADQPLKIDPPTTADRWLMRAMIIAALAILLGFFVWLLQPIHRGDAYLFWPLTAALALAALGWLFEWWYYWRIDAPPFRAPSRPYSVDVFTTACPGEPKEMIVRTLIAMQKITYPHTSYLCDEGDDPQLREVCRQLGVVHVTRTEKKHAKAGNINNALRQSRGEVCIVLDPDHEPAPFFIDRVIGYFDDPSVGFVQSVQPYRNQHTALVARGAAEMSYHFYGPIQMGMHGAGTPQAIGANCAFRRTALESIGGHASGLAEDMHTAMRLFSQGWRGLYVPEALTRGLVPQTLGGFYKQQIKWSCGVFDLLFQEYPKLFKGMTWNQRFHFALCPTYFMRGWITLAAIVVPLLCLLFGGIAWKITLGQFLLWALPLVAMVTIIRLASQRYLLEPSERGLHLTGGLLANGSWWVFIVGNLCALFRKKVPYLPTPKDDCREDAWKLAVPNLLVAGISLAAIPYGLWRDYSPFNLLMAAFALWNAGSLTFIAMLGQQRTTAALWAAFRRTSGEVRLAIRRAENASLRLVDLGQQLLGLGRRYPAAVAVAVLIAAGGVASVMGRHNIDASYANAWAHLIKDEKTDGGFYTGLYLPRDFDELPTLPAEVQQVEEKLGHKMDIVSVYIAWGPQSVEQFPEETLRQVHRDGGIPMITWEPWANLFPWAWETTEDLGHNRRVFWYMHQGAFDYYIRDFADKLRQLDGPVLLRFGHEMDNPQYPWSHVGGNTPDDFKAAWRHVSRLFNERGAANVAFVYNPWRADAIDRYYPGDEYVDWIGLTVLNYGQAGRDQRWHPFDQLYEEFHHKLKGYDKPIMLAEFGTTPYGGDQAQWLADAYRDIRTKYTDIHAAVLFHSDRDKNWATDWRPSAEAPGIDWTALQHPEAAKAVREGLARFKTGKRRAAGNTVQQLYAAAHERAAEHPAPRASRLVGEPGAYTLMVDDEPFYVRGVAYNPGHDWRDGGAVLTRRQLEKDLSAIKAMGANTIRRYTGGWADYNLFNVAAEQDLKVIYGLWLKQDVDYLSEDRLLDEMEHKFLKLVETHKDQEALLAWVIGNEAWGMFKHTYEQPYLTDVRAAYVRFVERLARRIKEVDPHRPVLVALENSDQLAGAVTDYMALAPSVDAIGINVYYEPHLDYLPELMATHAPGKPYLIAEFGPDGYWHPSYTPRDAAGKLAEPSATAKAQTYTRRWAKHVEAHRGHNLGGVAYCWSQRYEGTSTWFGLTDRDGRKLPGYYALREAWAGVPADPAPVIETFYASRQVGRPGQTIELRADIAAPNTQRLDSKWTVMSEDYRRAGALVHRPLDDPGHATLHLPTEPGWYRVHLSVRDPQTGRLDETSVPILIQDAGSAPTFVAGFPATLANDARRLNRVTP